MDEDMFGRSRDGQSTLVGGGMDETRCGNGGFQPELWVQRARGGTPVLLVFAPGKVQSLDNGAL
jgi:hypothetical protein